jgi:hypothetical protein
MRSEQAIHLGAAICWRRDDRGSRIAPADGATKVELSFTSQGLLANIIGNLFSRMIRDYVTVEAKGLKKRCDDLAFEKSSP